MLIYNSYSKVKSVHYIYVASRMCSSRLLRYVHKKVIKLSKLQYKEYYLLIYSLYRSSQIYPGESN